MSSNILPLYQQVRPFFTQKFLEVYRRSFIFVEEVKKSVNRFYTKVN